MPRSGVPHQRLANQLITTPRAAAPADVVRHFGAMQAQDYLASLWAVGLRAEDAVERDVEDAFATRAIIRTWPMRGTLHLVAADDVRWMLDLLTPRVIRRSAGRYRDLELDQGVFARARKVIVKALRDGRVATRTALYQLLNAAGIATAGSRGLHLLGHLAQEGLICFGPRKGRQPTFVLLPEWVPGARTRPREEALAEIAERYFASHGPAAVADFAWWSGLTITEARTAIDIAGPARVNVSSGGLGTTGVPDQPRSRPDRVHLLPPFDEYLVAYRDRSAVLDPRHGKAVNSGGGMLNPVIVAGGTVVGTWRRALTKDGVTVTLQPFAPLSAARLRAARAAAARYAAFLGAGRLRCDVA